MNRYVSIAALAAAALLALPEPATAGYPANLGFLPFGFYQPYGVRYRTSTPTPPYFALNPPVYYGARHARPYGLSPFASPPLVTPGAGYRSRLRTEFMEPVVPTPAPQCNPCVSHSQSVSNAGPSPTVAQGPVRDNPFVTVETPQLAQR